MYTYIMYVYINIYHFLFALIETLCRTCTQPQGDGDPRESRGDPQRFPRDPQALMALTPTWVSVFHSITELMSMKMRALKEARIWSYMIIYDRTWSCIIEWDHTLSNAMVHAHTWAYMINNHKSTLVILYDHIAAIFTELWLNRHPQRVFATRALRQTFTSCVRAPSLPP